MMNGDQSMTVHVNKIVGQCFYSLQNIKSIRLSLSTDATVTLVTRLICSRIDYCNIVFVGLQNSTIDRLQSVLHTAACIITGVKVMFTSHLPRETLRWLPVTQRITFKLCPTIYKALHGMTPSYSADFCRPVAATHYRQRLRSATHGDLVVPRNRLELGKRAFTVAGPTAWNNLPLSVPLAPSITTFKTAFKKQVFSA